MPTITARIARTILSALPIYNGKGRLIDRSLMRHIRFDETLLDIQTSDNFTLRVWPNDLIGRHIYLTGHFDRCVVDALVKYSPAGGCLWDIGANLGYVSCAFLTRVPDSKVLAIEPLRDVAKLLRHNLSQFKSERTNIIEAAVSDHVGMGNIVRVVGNIGHSHISESRVSGEVVELVTSSSLVEICPPD
jgi:FkbM family methyltransferase